MNDKTPGLFQTYRANITKSKLPDMNFNLLKFPSVFMIEKYRKQKIAETWNNIAKAIKIHAFHFSFLSKQGIANIIIQTATPCLICSENIKNPIKAKIVKKFNDGFFVSIQNL